MIQVNNKYRIIHDGRQYIPEVYEERREIVFRGKHKVMDEGWYQQTAYFPRLDQCLQWLCEHYANIPETQDVNEWMQRYESVVKDMKENFRSK